MTYVRYWPNADMSLCAAHVRFCPKQTYDVRSTVDVSKSSRL